VWVFINKMGSRKMDSPKMDFANDPDSLISPIYALTIAGKGSVGWMGYKVVAVDEPKKQTTLFLVDFGLSHRTLDAILHITIICLVLFIIVNCMCKFVWLFLK